MLSGYLQLLGTERRVLLFGALCTFLSSPGQTFFIAVYVGSFGAAAGLDASALGALYLAGALGSAALLPALGHWIDRVDLRAYAGLVVVGLALACFSAALVIGPVSLFIAFMLLRLFGQGLMTHVAVTSIARYFRSRRGLALSLTTMGLALATAVLPTLAVLAIAQYGWRLSYAGLGVLLLCIALPLLLKLIADKEAFTRPPASRKDSPPPRAWEGLMIVATTRYFWLALPIILYMPFSSTALVFHIEAVGMAKGWSRELVATAFGAYAVGHALGLVLAGIVVDRLTARVMMPLMNLPLFVGVMILGLFDAASAAFVFLLCVGVSLGLVQTTMGAVWVEVYGTARLGTIRSFATMLMIVASASGPAVIGLGLDIDLPIDTICWSLLAFGLVGTLLASLGVSTGVAGGEGASK